MANVSDKIAVYLKEQQEKIERLRSLVGPLFTVDSFDDAVKKYTANSKMYIHRMIDNDIQAHTLQLMSSMESSTSSSALTEAPQMGTSSSAQALPIAVESDAKEYSRHSKLHEDRGHTIDPKKRDGLHIHSWNDNKVVSESLPTRLSQERELLKSIASPKVIDRTSKKRRAAINTDDGDHPGEGDSATILSSNDNEKGLTNGIAKPAVYKCKGRHYSEEFKIHIIQKFDALMDTGNFGEFEAARHLGAQIGCSSQTVLNWTRGRKKIKVINDLMEQRKNLGAILKRNAERSDESSQIAAALTLNNSDSANG